VSAALSTDIADFSREDFTFDGKTRAVLRIGDAGPAVIVIHEIFGFTPTLARLCRWLRDAGFSVYAPILVGKPDATNAEKTTANVMLPRILSLCVSREFTIFATGKSSPIVEWLKPLARALHQRHGGKGVGVIGMCLTGGFALNMAVDPAVVAPVLSQPSMPPRHPGEIDATPQEIAVVRRRMAEEGLKVRGYRFEGDAGCQAPRFETLSRLLGDGFLGKVLPDEWANPAGAKAQGRTPHSVFTGDLIDEPGSPTRALVDELIGFYSERLKG
jgi:dienelactone hydrolase